jgi:hypothetical protein
VVVSQLQRVRPRRHSLKVGVSRRVEDARGVVLKRACPKTSVALGRRITAREGEKISAVIRMEKNEDVLVEWRNI